MKTKIETGRVCAVCQRTTSPWGMKVTYGFHTMLRLNNIEGDKAHLDCIMHLKDLVPLKSKE